MRLLKNLKKIGVVIAVAIALGGGVFCIFFLVYMTVNEIRKPAEVKAQEAAARQERSREQYRHRAEQFIGGGIIMPYPDGGCIFYRDYPDTPELPPIIAAIPCPRDKE